MVPTHECRPECIHGDRTESIPALVECSRRRSGSAALVPYNTSSATAYRQTARLVRHFLFRFFGNVSACPLVAAAAMEPIPFAILERSRILLTENVRVSCLDVDARPDWSVQGISTVSIKRSGSLERSWRFMTRAGMAPGGHHTEPPMIPSLEKLNRSVCFLSEVFALVLYVQRQGDGHDALQTGIHAHHEESLFIYLDQFQMSIFARLRSWFHNIHAV